MKVELEVVKFDVNDIITTSGGNLPPETEENDLPIV